MTWSAIRKIFLFVPLAFFFLAGSESCGKTYDLNGVDWQPDTPPSDSVYDREVTVLNLGDNLPAGDVPVDSADPLYFSLQKFSTVHIAYQATNRWDLAFLGAYRSQITSNNGSTNVSLGYGSSATGGMIVYDSAYSSVTTIPDDAVFQVPGVSGLDDIGFFGQGIGHVAYTYFGNEFRPDKVVGYLDPTYPAAVQVEAANYAHMIYALSERFAKAYPVTIRGDSTRPRTIMVRTAKGDYAKVEILSYYDQTLDPADMNQSKGYSISFHYMIVPANEKRFGFTARRKPLTVNLATGAIFVGP